MTIETDDSTALEDDLAAAAAAFAENMTVVGLAKMRALQRRRDGLPRDSAGMTKILTSAGPKPDGSPDYRLYPTPEAAWSAFRKVHPMHPSLRWGPALIYRGEGCYVFARTAESQND